jgi:hypothetical protein
MTTDVAILSEVTFDADIPLGGARSPRRMSAKRLHRPRRDDHATAVSVFRLGKTAKLHASAAPSH